MYSKTLSHQPPTSVLTNMIEMQYNQKAIKSVVKSLS